MLGAWRGPGVWVKLFEGATKGVVMHVNPRWGYRLAGWVLAALWCCTQGAAQAQTLARLPALGLRADGVTVSGLSSGGYMAGQFQVAYSSRLSGAAIIAGGPYGCSRGAVSTASLKCSCPAKPPLVLQWMAWVPGLGCEVLAPEVYATTSDRATVGNQGHIDDPVHLRTHRVWLFSGGEDRVVDRQLVQSAADYYRRRGVPASNIRQVDRPDAGHGLPSLSADQACSVTGTPFLTQCQLDAAGELLQWLYPPAAGEPGLQAQPVQGASLKRFRQARYGSTADTGLDTSAWVYIPRACEAAGAACRLHVVFHGCEQGQSFPVRSGAGALRPFGLRFVRGAGYNAWAQGSNIVVLYPQVAASEQGSLSDPHRYNPKGCWDFWGYTERYAALNPDAPHFARASAPQMRAVMAMIDDLMRAP